MRFLAQNNFDFNTLFRSAINYAKRSEFGDILDKCVYRVGKHDPHVRTFEALSTSHQVQLERIMEEVKEWVYNPNSEKKLFFTIQSPSVRKCLDKQVKAEYMGSGVFYNWSRASTEVFVEKTRRF